MSDDTSNKPGTPADNPQQPDPSIPVITDLVALLNALSQGNLQIQPLPPLPREKTPVACAVISFQDAHVVSFAAQAGTVDVTIAYEKLTLVASDADGRTYAELSSEDAQVLTTQEGGNTQHYTIRSVPAEAVPVLQIAPHDILTGNVTLWMDATADKDANGAVHVELGSTVDKVDFDFPNWSARI